MRRQCTTGALDPLAKAEGWTSPIDRTLLQTLVDERPDRTTEELTRGVQPARGRGRTESVITTT